MKSRRLAVCLVAVCAFVAGHGPVWAQSPATPSNPLEQIGWFAGGTWTAEEKASDGSTLLVKMNCYWGDTRHALLFKVSFVAGGRETPQYDGMFVWHPGKKTLTLWQVNRHGEVAEGELTVNGEEMDQVVRVSHPDGGAHFLKARYQRLNNDAFRFKAFFRLAESDPWQDAVDVIYKRQPAGKPGGPGASEK